MIMLNPSFDFSLFSTPNFSPLQANAFGAFTDFSANTPAPFVDYSINRLNQILATPNELPFPSAIYPDIFGFQNPQGGYDPRRGPIVNQPSINPNEIQNAIERARRVRDEAQRILDQVGDTSKAPGNQQSKDTNVQVEENCLVRNPFTGKCIWSIGYGKAAREAAKKLPAPEGEPLTKFSWKDFWEGLPAGAGVFLIAIVAIIFLILFARR